MKNYLTVNNWRSLPRGIRNNNPGNLIATSIPWLGKVPIIQNTDTNKKFEQFTNLGWGIRAAAMDILGDIYKKNNNTITKLISVYAPKHENPTEKYIDFVVKATGIERDEDLRPILMKGKTVTNPDNLAQILTAIFRMENGATFQKYITYEDIRAGIDLLGKKKIETSAPVKITAGINWILPALIIGGFLITRK